MRMTPSNVVVCVLDIARADEDLVGLKPPDRTRQNGAAFTESVRRRLDLRG